jgi:hypothetical protein
MHFRHFILKIKEGVAAYAAGGPQEINIDEAWGKTYKILKSGTPYAVALYLNIQQFSGALDATKELKVCQDKIADLQTQMDALRLQVDGLTSPPASSDQQAGSLEKEAM